MYPACNAHEPCCHLWPVQLYKIFPHYLINGTIFEKQKDIEHKKGVLIFSTQLRNISYARRNEQDMIKNVYWSGRKVLVTLVRFLMKLEISRQISKYTQIPNVMKICQEGHGQTDGQI
jgi:hypothetical protein